MDKWAPIVFAPTYTVEIHFLALPDFLASEEEQQWAKKHITATMYNAHEMIHGQHWGPRWAVFQSEKYRVFGVTGMARDLGGENYKMTQDAWERPIFVFVGYATLRTEHSLFPTLPVYSKSLNQFMGLFQYVRAHWDDLHEGAPDYISLREMYFEKPARRYIRRDVYHRKGRQRRWSRRSARKQLNEDLNQQALWPDTQFQRYRLWQEASLCNGPLSLCLTLASKRDAQKGSFMNVTVVGLIEKERLRRIGS